MKMDVKELYLKVNELMGTEVKVEGWIRNHRKQAHFGFIDFHDGTNFKSVQVVYEDHIVENFEEITKSKVLSIDNSKVTNTTYNIQIEMFITTM